MTSNFLASLSQVEIPASFERYEVHTDRTPFWKLRTKLDVISVVRDGREIVRIEGWKPVLTSELLDDTYDIDGPPTWKEECRIIAVKNRRTKQEDMTLVGIREFRYRVRGQEWISIQSRPNDILALDENGYVVAGLELNRDEDCDKSPIKSYIFLDPNQSDLEKVGACFAMCTVFYGFNP